jgi:DUF971 family protein
MNYHLPVKPERYQLIGDELVVVWADGHESYYRLEELRRACPCAACSGEPDLFGRMSRPMKQPYRAESFELRRIEPSGNYGLQLNWADGHSFGIWTYQSLRAACPCRTCQPERPEAD